MSQDRIDQRRPNARAGQRDRPVWQLTRLEIRTTTSPEQWPLARVELLHMERGRLTDIAMKEGPMECVFLAIRRMVGLDAVIAALSLDYVPAPQASGGPCQVTARVKLAVDGSSYEGVSTCEDIVQSCAQAYLHALSQAEEACRLNGRPPEQFNCIW